MDEKYEVQPVLQLIKLELIDTLRSDLFTETGNRSYYQTLAAIMLKINELITNYNQVSDVVNEFTEKINSSITDINNVLEDLSNKVESGFFIGPMPKHEWNGTKLRFEERPDKWGAWTEIHDLDAVDKEVIKLFDELVEKNKPKKEVTLLIGDSYLRGKSNGLYIKSWGDYLIEMMKLKKDDTVFVYGENGSGFVRKGDKEHNFSDLIRLHPVNNDVNVTKIIVCGGHNDLSQTVDNIRAGIIDVCNYAKSNFPNAKVYVGMIGGTVVLNVDSTRRSIYKEVLLSYNNAGIFLPNIVYMPNLYQIAKDPLNFSEDHYHMNEKGYRKIAHGVYQSMQGDFSYKSPTYKYALKFIGADPINSRDTLSCNVRIIGDITQINIPEQVISYADHIVPDIYNRDGLAPNRYYVKIEKQTFVSTGTNYCINGSVSNGIDVKSSMIDLYPNSASTELYCAFEFEKVGKVSKILFKKTSLVVPTIELFMCYPENVTDAFG